MKGKLFTILAGILLLGSLAGCGDRAVSQNAPAGTDKAWYTQVLNDPTVRESYSFYRIIDINPNGSPILFLSSTADSFISNQEKAQLIVFSGGEPETVREIGGSGGEMFYCNAAENTLTYFYRFSGESHIEVYNLKDGTLERITVTDIYSPHHFPEEDNQDVIFLQDGKKISKEESNALWEKYANERDAVTYEPIE